MATISCLLAPLPIRIFIFYRSYYLMAASRFVCAISRAVSFCRAVIIFLMFDATLLICLRFVFAVIMLRYARRYLLFHASCF